MSEPTLILFPILDPAGAVELALADLLELADLLALALEAEAALALEAEEALETDDAADVAADPRALDADEMTPEICEEADSKIDDATSEGTLYSV